MKNVKSIAIYGANGKMGKEICKILSQKKINYIKIKNLNEVKIQHISIVIDFSSPEGFDQALDFALKIKKPFVSGTTGLTKLQFNKMKKSGKKIPILWSPNMSLGVALLKKALNVFHDITDFNFQIEELHHKYKKDSPSGTAINLQAELQKQTQKKLPKIISIRKGRIFGIHKIHAQSKDEHVIFEHEALNRRVFATGAIRAAMWLQNKSNGVYKIEDVLNG